jgi:hypothetical protein
MRLFQKKSKNSIFGQFLPILATFYGLKKVEKVEKSW